MKSELTARANTTIKVPVSLVWEALSSPEIIKQYFYGTEIESDWEVGGSIIFKREYNGTPYEDKGYILKIIPNQLFKYNYWNSMSGTEDRHENYSDITYDLSEHEDGTHLEIIQDNIKDEKTKENAEKMWKDILENMKELLEVKAI